MTQTKEYAREWRRKNPDKVKRKRDTWKARNVEKYFAYHRARAARTPSLYHGFTYAEILQFLREQGGGCLICGTRTVGSARWHGDHDHSTGKFRGVLCGKCNMGLGLFRDDAALLSKAAEYLRR